MSAPRIIRTGRDHTWTAPMSDMQREKAEGPWEDCEFTGRYRLLSWAICLVVSGLMWMAILTWVLP